MTQGHIQTRYIYQRRDVECEGGVWESKKVAYEMDATKMFGKIKLRIDCIKWCLLFIFIVDPIWRVVPIKVMKGRMEGRKDAWK